MRQESENFYRKGYEVFKFNSISIKETLEDILSGKIKKGFSLECKYSKALDLRPNVIDYSDGFLNVLKENNIKNFLRSRTYKDFTLYHIQARTTQSEISYLDWHRDTCFNGEKKIGMTPPGLKLIYYPSFSEDPSSRLLVLPESHRYMNSDLEKDLEYAKSKKHEEINSNNDQAVLFEASLFHAVVPDKKNCKSIRLIYSFVTKEQVPDDQKNLHYITSKRYEEMF